VRYFLTRVSSKDQNLARQLKVARERFEIPDENVFCDKASGKDFDRAEYQRLKTVVVAGDEVIVKEFDRFGRNKDEMKRELEWFKQRGVMVRILDIPTTLIDFKDQTWVLEMVNNILIEVLGTIAEQEREKSKRRQREGLDAMPVVNGKKVSTKTGNSIGRPKRILNFEKIIKKQKDGLISVADACQELGISRTQWYRETKNKTAALG
jgi:DNA invertase Pin-like site-specific DNA recombinase